MASPHESPERIVSTRRFLGVNTQYDSVFLGGQFLKFSQNFYPSVSFRLATRPGSLLDKNTGAGTVNITDLLHVVDKEIRYLFAYCQRTVAGGNDFFAVFINDGPVQYVVNCTFASSLKDGHFIRFGNYVYVGNGVDPIKQIKLADPIIQVVNLSPIGSNANGTYTHPASTTTIVSKLVPGEYQFCYAVYNKDTMFYESRSDADKATVAAGEYLHFVPPATPAAPLVNRLFVSPVNDPIEFASCQFVGQDPAVAVDVTEVDVNQQFVPLKDNVKRSGSFFTLFLNRLVFGGTDDDPYAAFATGTLLPGVEQDDFNSGLFFPSYARIPMPEKVTAVGVAGVTSGFDPQSPLIIQTVNRTTLYTGGDPYDPHGGAIRAELSARVGCPAPDTGLSTPFGYFFLSADSVYMIPPGGGYPQDVGWPIGNLLREIPSGRRMDANAIFHKGFYKLAFSRPGEGENATQFWLDLRQGVTSPPSWWGPMIGTDVSAFTATLEHPQEYDRGWCAVANTDCILLIHQKGSLIDYQCTMGTTESGPQPIISVLRTGTFDDDAPFDMKVFTRIRALVLGTNHDKIDISVVTDTGKPWGLDPMEVFAEQGAQWNVSDWNHLVPEGKAQWTIRILSETQTIAKLTRPRGLSCEIIATHPSVAVRDPDVIAYPNIEIRDVQILYNPVDRKVRTIGEKSS